MAKEPSLVLYSFFVKRGQRQGGKTEEAKTRKTENKNSSFPSLGKSRSVRPSAEAMYNAKK
jgi:hypothetical protein